MVHWIIEGMLPSALIMQMPDELLCDFASINSGLALWHVKNFISKYESTYNEDDKELVEKLKRCYASVMQREEFYQNPEMRNIVKSLRMISYESVSLQEDENKLRKWREDLEFTLNHPYFQAYEPVISEKDIIATFIEMKRKCAENPELTPFTGLVKELELIIRDKMGFWKGAVAKKPKPTMFVGLVMEQTKYELILYGLNFILDKIERRANPMTWRSL